MLNKYSKIIASATVVLLVSIVVLLFMRSGDVAIVPRIGNVASQQSVVTSMRQVNDNIESATVNGIYDFTEAVEHIGEKASVKGKVFRVFTSKSGVTFLDFCEKFDDCPFSAVIFASDLEKFPNVKQYERSMTLTGLIKSYNGKAEIILDSPDQIK